MTSQSTTPRSYRWVAVPLLMFALFALTAGLLAAHDPRSSGYFRLFFEDPIHLKAGFASAAAALACFQVFSATWIYRKLPWHKPPWINVVHRWSGRLAFVFTLPVAYHCIFKLGFQDPTTRVLAHSLPVAAASANGDIGPNLDALRPTVAQVQAKVEQGGGVMPSFRNRLTAAQIRAVAEFVASRAGSP